MSKKVLFLFVAGLVGVSVALAGGSKRKIQMEALPDERPAPTNAPITPEPVVDWSKMHTDVGTFTTLSGFYDYQSNGGSIQQIRVNPANGNIHVTFMTSADSTAAGLNSNRRVKYAFSSNGGSSWTNNVQVPLAVRSGFPTIDIIKGGDLAGQPVIASHPDGNPTIAKVFIEDPVNPGEFVDLTPPLVSGASLQPIWPYVAGTSNGSLVVSASQNSTATTGVGFQQRVAPDFSWNGTWDMWAGDIQSGGRYPAQANNNGRVGILWNTSNGTAVLGNRWRESTDNGVTWSAPVNIYSTRTAGADTFNAYVHCDFVYDGNNPLMAFSEYYVPADRNDANIVFWSQATGFKVAARYDSTKYFFDPINQRFHAFQVGWPSIGMSGSTIVIAYQAFQADLDTTTHEATPLVYHFSDLWYVASSDGGNTWGAPQPITHTPRVDERYPSVSKWNAPGQFNMVWTQKSKSGLFAFPGLADTVRTSQVFLRVSPIMFTTSVGEGEPGIANSYTLGQNYPNPFNPGTVINYTVPKSGLVTIKVYDILGKEIATLLNEELRPGSYEVNFDGSRLASGIYFYTMTANGFSQSKKMMLLK